MPFFAYKGRNPRGELVQGRLEGNDSSAIADHLLNTGVTPIEIRAAAGGLEPGDLAIPEALRRMFQPPITLVPFSGGVSSMSAPTITSVPSISSRGV